MIVKAYVKRLIHSDKMLYGVTLVSFLESLVVPIPLETLLIPLMQARREKIWLIATCTTFGCLIGAILGYYVGYFLFDVFHDLIMQYVTTEAQFAAFQAQMNTHGFWFIFSTGVTPVPLQVAMLLAGLSSYSFFLYILAVASSRFIRYFGFAALVYFFGNKTEKIIKRYKWQTISIVLVFIATLIIYNVLSV